MEMNSMKEKLTAILVAAIMAVSIVGCDIQANAGKNYGNEGNTYFDVHRVNFGDGAYNGDLGCYVFVDKETGVCYLEHNSIHGCSITVMLNADGTPKVWEKNE